MSRSHTTTSGLCRRARFNPISPSCASRAFQPFCASSAAMMGRSASSSSINKTAFILWRRFPIWRLICERTVTGPGEMKTENPRPAGSKNFCSIVCFCRRLRGSKRMEKIPLSKCFVNSEVEEAALRALCSGQYILGKECQAFETELAAHTGAKHAILGSSWTMIVYLLHQLQGVGPGDEIIVPSHTAFPSMEPLIHLGARPVFADIDDTYGMDLDHVESLITPRTVGIIGVHLYGHPVDNDRLLAIAAKNHLWAIEDCAQGQGAKYKDKTVGSMGHFGAFSFFPSKNLTVLGDGGCITTNNDQMAERLRMLRNHGRKDKYLHEFTGYNVRFNEINGAIGRVMLKHLDSFNARRREIAVRYNERLKGVVLATPPERSWAKAVYHMYVVRAERRDELQKFLKEKGIETGIHYPVPNHLQPAVTALFPFTPKLPKTEAVVKEILSLPISGEITLEAADRVCDAIEEFYQRK